jgi:hypothetical protein
MTDDFDEQMEASGLGAPRVVDAAAQVPPEVRAELQRVAWRQELLILLAQEESPAQLRRIAEVTEALFDVVTAEPWWKKAAEAGDADAADILPLLKDDVADITPEFVDEFRRFLLRLARPEGASGESV